MKLDFDLMRNVLKTGAIAPVSNNASKSMVKVLKRWIDSDDIASGKVAEFGAGPGNITRYLERQGWSTIYAFEVLETLCEKLSIRFEERNVVKIINESVENLDKHIEDESLEAIISTIPMTFLEDSLDDILEKSYNALKPGGIFLMGQVRSSQNERVEKKIGPMIYESRQRLSLPPVLVTAYKKL